MTDMSLHIAPKSDQINADDLIAGPRTITITSVSDKAGTAEQPIAVFFQGDNGKPYRPCKSMRRVMVHCWGRDGNLYAGRSMTIYRDPEVTWGGAKVGGIRISHMSHIEREQIMALTATQKQRKPYRVLPLVVDVEPAPDDEDAQEEAREAARGGTEAFRQWWAANPSLRTAAKPIMPELQRIAADADDAAATTESDDPFAPTPEQLAAAEAEARAEADRIAQEASQ